MKKFSHLKNMVASKEYRNVASAFHWGRIIRRVFGTSVFEAEITSDNRTIVRWSKLGFVSYVFWGALYVYCAYIAQSKDQTILRNLYQTKLQRYGDDFERISSFMYVVSTLYLTPFRLSGNNGLIQKLNDLDTFIKETGVQLDYTHIARRSLLISVGQVCVYLLRMACIWVPIKNANQSIPAEKIFQVVYSDAQAIILTAIFCFFMIILRDKFKWINKVLREIKERSYWEHKVYFRGAMTPNVAKVAQIQDKHIRGKLKTCARAYGMLFKICVNVNCVFGFALLITLFQYLNIIILYLFYFMEATASGLFHDVKAYADFLVYGFWEIAIAFGIIFFIVYFCESVMKEANHVAFIVHEIINGDFSSEINTEAMQFSVQLLHEKLVFTVLGLFDLNYFLLQQGARSVSTYLVILLQFVTEKSQMIKDISLS